MLDDVLIENKQATNMAEIYTQILGSLSDAFGAIVSNNLNKVMKVLTGLTIVFMIPGMIGAFYGMNVALPFSDSPYAFTVLCLVGLDISFAVFYMLKKGPGITLPGTAPNRATERKRRPPHLLPALRSTPISLFLRDLDRIRNNRSPIVLYGYAKLSKRLLAFLNLCSIEVATITVDRDYLNHTRTENGCPVVAIEDCIERGTKTKELSWLSLLFIPITTITVQPLYCHE